MEGDIKQFRWIVKMEEYWNPRAFTRQPVGRSRNRVAIDNSSFMTVFNGHNLS